MREETCKMIKNWGMCQSQGHGVFGRWRQEQEPGILASRHSQILQKMAMLCTALVLPIRDHNRTLYWLNSCLLVSLESFFQRCVPSLLLQGFKGASQRGKVYFERQGWVFQLKRRQPETLLCGGEELCFLPMDNPNTHITWLRKYKTSGATTAEMPWLQAYAGWFTDPLCTQWSCSSCTWKMRLKLAWRKH